MEKKKRENGLSYAEILVSFLKGMIGPGCLSLPLAFRQAGLWTGLALMFIFGFLNTICMLKLVRCSQLLAARSKEDSSDAAASFLDFGNMAHTSVAHSFQPIRHYAKWAKMLVNLSIIFMQMGVCSVFYVFCGVHLKEFFDVFGHQQFHTITSTGWMLLIFVPFLLINFVRSLRAIALLSTVGNVLCLGALAAIFYHLLQASHQIWQLPWITHFEGVMTACGSILYSFEGQAMVLPLENRLRHPQQMLGPFGILSVGMSIILLVYASSGFLGYITFGQAVRGSITLNLPQHNIEFSMISLALILVIYLGFVIQMFVVVEMLWPPLWKLFEQRGIFVNKKLLVELLFRAFLVGITMIIAVAVPNLEQIIPLVGVTTGMLLAFVLPALLDMCTFLPVLLMENQQKKRRRAAAILTVEDMLLVGIGLFGLCAGLHANMATIFGTK